ncbi:MAG: glycosyltransferase family 39 protein [Vicinamibacterales bacterium]
MFATAALLFVVLFWRLGAASFWDPDEAHYAQTTRELLASGDWAAPFYNGRPFFDKPILFYWLQALPMSVAPASEAAARFMPAVAGVLLVAVTAWCGAQLYGAGVGLTAALMLATNAGLFGLARYAILDLPFALFLFSGLSFVTVAIVRERRQLEYAGYVMFGLAHALKGPVALVLAGLTMAAGCAVSASTRRDLLSLRWVQGAIIATLPGLPWPLYMLARFGREFVDGYILNENLKLFATPMYAGQPGWYFYLSIVAVGLLPWTGLLLARLGDAVRRMRQAEELDRADILLWCWIFSIVVFFSFSQFKLDHYVFPTTPALCLLCARVWEEAGRTGSAGVARRGAQTVGPVLIVAGAVVAYLALAVLAIDRMFVVVPVVLLAAGLLTTVQTAPGRMLPALPLAPVVAMGLLYFGAVAWVIPGLEEGKVVPDVARWVASHAGSSDRVATFRLNRWNTAYRFYVERPVTIVESDEDARQFFSAPQPYYIVMTGQLFEALRAAGVPLRIAYEREGRWVTSGKALWRRNTDLTRFVVAVPDAAPAAP